MVCRQPIEGLMLLLLFSCSPVQPRTEAQTRAPAARQAPIVAATLGQPSTGQSREASAMAAPAASRPEANTSFFEKVHDWAHPDVVEQLAAECAFVPRRSSNPYKVPPPDPMVCFAGHEHHNDDRTSPSCHRAIVQCEQGCEDGCSTCTSLCIDTCGTCKRECHDAECRLKCAQQTAGCRTLCSAELTACSNRLCAQANPCARKK
jgi:hypothetical protein